MYVSTLSQLAYVTDRQRREQDERMGQLAGMWTRRRRGRRRPARVRRAPSVSDVLAMP